jgi:hypothetical protein
VEGGIKHHNYSPEMALNTQPKVGAIFMGRFLWLYNSIHHNDGVSVVISIES